MKFKEITLTPKYGKKVVNIDGIGGLMIKTYLPINEKIDLVRYIIEKVIDEESGTSSPIRAEVFFQIAICKWYAGIEVDADDDVSYVYDTLETNGVLSSIIAAIPTEEYEFIFNIVESTIADMTKYMSSAAGIVRAMTDRTSGLNDQVDQIIAKLRSEDNLKEIKAIKELVETV